MGTCNLQRLIVSEGISEKAQDTAEPGASHGGLILALHSGLSEGFFSFLLEGR